MRSGDNYRSRTLHNVIYIRRAEAHAGHTRGENYIPRTSQTSVTKANIMAKKPAKKSVKKPAKKKSAAKKK
jgi:hypothetical protein